MKDRPLVSIIIPTYNSQATLGRCLDSIRSQTYKNIEVITVDGGSTDETVEIARNRGATVYIMDRRGRSRQTNYGAKMAKGKYIYRIEHDVILDPTIVEEAAAKCEDEGYDAISIFYSPDPTISFWAKVRKLEKDCYKDELLYTGARFFRKDVFEAIGGFRENIVADECYELNSRLRKTAFKIGKIKSQELHIGEPNTLMDVARKQFYYGLTFKEFLKLDPLANAFQLNPARLPLIRNWKKFAKHPVLMLGFIVYDCVQYVSALAGLIVSYVRRRGSVEQ